MPTSVRSHAKINLGLFLGAPRSDGFHALITVYQTLEIHDVVTVTARPARETVLRIISNDLRVPNDSRNTAWKMISLALEKLNIAAEVEVYIDKRLPVQGGLGAGSGNAVAALVGLETELEKQGVENGGRGTERSRELRPGALAWANEWQRIAAQVGSDVPLFLIGGTVLGVDRGQEVHPLPDIEPVWCVVAIPDAGVSTPQAFRDWDTLCAVEGLTAEASADRLEKSSRTYAAALLDECEGVRKVGSSGVFSKGEDLAGPQKSELVRTGITSWIENDFERVVFPQHPSLVEIKHLLAGAGAPEAALYSALSGSGSALFGLYRTRGDAEAAKDRVESRVPRVTSHVTRTLPRSAYWDQMILKDS
jgi:4-diphosphocytidyl-2-C-methyl-D-erythritol kinase